MPKLVPLHSVMIGRPDPKGRKDKHGNEVHTRVRPKIGEPFDFTDDEAADLRRSGHEFRTPRNETSDETPEGDADDLDRVAAEAAAEATKHRSAPLDAANTRRAGARGKAKPPVVETGTAVDDEDEL